MQKTITASAPGKIILFGEHAVVYDKLGIACTINKRCTVKVSPIQENLLIFDAQDINIQQTLNKEELFSFYEKVNNLKEEKRFKELRGATIEKNMPASIFVIASILKKYGFVGFKIEGQSEIPKNLGSSSAAFSSTALAVLKFLGQKPSKKEISGFAYLGDVIAHGGTPSGIDNTVVTYGGYITYRKSEGIKPLNIDFKIPLLIVNSGKKAETAKTVSYIREQREKNPDFVNPVMDALDNITKKALNTLKNHDLKNLGKLMIEYYRELKKLDISTPELDKIIDIAIKNNALGVKPTGGWGGGCSLVLAQNEEQLLILKEKFKKAGFDSFKAEIGDEGVKQIN